MSLLKDVLSFKGIKPGKRLLVLGAVHGDEVCGPIAIRRWIKRLSDGNVQFLSGSVTFVPVCNPEAYRLKKRYSEENLNRVFRKHENPRTYEQRLANELTELFDEADYILDLHSQHVSGESFCFAENETPPLLDFISALCPHHVLFGWGTLYPEGDFTTESYAAGLGKICTTVECGLHDDPRAIDVAEEMIFRAMRFLGMIENLDDRHSELVSGSHEKMLKRVQHDDIPDTSFIPIHLRRVHRFKKGGKLAWDFKHLDKFKKGDVLAVYADGSKITTDFDGVIVLPKTDDGIRDGDEWFYLGITRAR